MTPIDLGITVVMVELGADELEIWMTKKNELGAEALREIANIIDRDWAQLGTRSLILKTIRDRADALDGGAALAALEGEIAELRRLGDLEWDKGDKATASRYHDKARKLRERGTR